MYFDALKTCNECKMIKTHKNRGINPIQTHPYKTMSVFKSDINRYQGVLAGTSQGSTGITSMVLQTYYS